MMLIEVLPLAPAFQPCQGLHMHVRLRNGGAPVEVPNPAALRASPSWRLSRWPPSQGMVIGNQQGYAPPPDEPELLTLGTGSGWDGAVTVSDDNAALTPGDWAVSLLLPVDGTVQESPPCKVRVAEWCIEAADAGFGAPRFGRQNGDTLLLQRGAGPMTLYRMPWAENHGDRTGHGGARPIPLCEPAANASDPLVPVRDGTFYGDGARWLLWREGAVVRALGEANEQQSLELENRPAALLRPALQRTGEGILVVALAATRDRLMLLRFPRSEETPPQIDGEVALPCVVASGTPAFAPGGGVLIALASATADGVTLLLLSPPDSRPPRTAWFAGVSLVESVAPAVLVEDDGGIRIGALLLTAEGVGLAEARFPADIAASAATSIRPLGGQDAAPVRGALLYHRADGGEAGSEAPAPSAVVVVGRADGTALGLDGDGMLRPVFFQAPPVASFALVPGVECPYLLCCDPMLGPFMAEV